MKVTCACGVCGHESENRKEIEECEAQGARNVFSVGEEVEFLWMPNPGDGYWIKGRIEEIKFEERTHEATYLVVVSPEDNKLPEWLTREMENAGMKKVILGTDEKHMVTGEKRRVEGKAN